MDRLPFVGRQAELSTLHDAVTRGADGQGSVVLVEGAQGVGKSVLLAELVRTMSDSAGPGAPLFAIGRCFADTGPQNAYQPFVEILHELDRGGGAGVRHLRDFGKVLKEIAPGWLALLPTVGPTIAITTKTATLAGEVLLRGRATTGRTEGLVGQYLAAIDRLLKDKQLVVLIIEDAQWIDRASADLMLRLADRTLTQRLVLILTCRPGDFDSDTPLGHLRLELGARDRLETLAVGGLTEAQIRTYLLQRFNTAFGRDFPNWLIHLCQGNAFFVSQYLSFLEEKGVIERVGIGFVLHGSVEQVDRRWLVRGPLDGVPVPTSIKVLLEHRIDDLLEEESMMLEIGSVQGQYFDSLVVAEVSETKERAVLAQLRKVAERHHLISLSTGQDWEQDRSETYAFEHQLMHQAFYDNLHPREQRLHHQAVGRVLQHIATEYPTPPRKLLIDIAYHAAKSFDHKTAAEYYLRAAQATHADGASVEASHLALSAIESLRTLPPGDVGNDALLAEAILLLLVCAHYSSASLAGTVDFLELATEGELAADRAGLRSLHAEIVATKGHFHIRAGHVPEAIIVMRRALALARETGDPLTEFYALTQLGSQLAKENLPESVAIRHEAVEFFEKNVSIEGLSPAQKDLILGQHASALVLVGLGEFDAGNYEAGIEWLERGIGELRKTRKIDELPAALNYLAQVYTCIGRFEDAQRILEDSMRAPDGSERDHRDVWIGYNLGLLAKVHLEAGHIGTAARVVDEAAQISESFRHMDLLTLVWNYQAEVLMHPDNPGVDLDAAERVLRNNLEVSTAAGLQRTATPASSMLGQVLLRRGSLAEAETHSARAVADIERMGDMPAVRTEEIYYNRSLVLDGLGRTAEALASLSRAWEVVQAKLERMEDPANREAFTGLVPLTIAIMTAYQRRSIADTAAVVDGAQ